MKNPIKFLKHIVKDPIKTIAEADARKKEIMPLFYGSVGVMVVGIILQIVAELDFMTAFSFIGLLGAGFCGFLFMVINKAKTRFQTLTCDRCNTLAEIKTPEEFAKYVSYTIEKDEAKFHGYTGNKKPTDGIYSLVKFSGSASAVLAVTLTCPHCGEVKHLRFSADTFKCHAEATRVGALQLAGVSASLEAAVKEAVRDYNDPDKRGSIPYTYHSSKNPNFENRYSFKGANAAGAHPSYMGAMIDYHKDAEEILEHYFVFNELTGTLTDPNAASKKPKNAQIPDAQKDSGAKPERIEEEDEAAPGVSTGETLSKQPATVVPEENRAQKRHHNKSDKRVVAIAAVCAVLIVGAVIVGVSLANRDKGEEGKETDPYVESTSQQSETASTAATVTEEKLNVNDYVGYWHVKENSEKELTIHSGSGDEVIFSLWYAKKDEIKNVGAQLTDNVATFSLAVEGTVIKGSLTFLKDAITVSITQSTLMTIPVEELTFTELHMSSLVPSKDDSSSSDDPTEDSKPPMQETPYLFSATEGAYEIYKEPSYSSTYVEMLPKGTFTIVDQEYDANNNLWGKLKSGLGWICVAENTEE